MIFPFLLVMICAVFFSIGCNKRQLVLAADQYWHSSGYFTDKRIKNLEQLAAKGGVTLELTRIEYSGNPEISLRAEFAENVPDMVLLSPLLTNALSSGAPAANDTQYYGIASSGSSTGMGTFIVRREPAFRDLGKELCGDEEISENGKIVGAWYTGTAQTRREYDVFYDAFTEECSDAVLDIQLLESDGTGAIESYLREGDFESAGFGVIFAGRGNGAIQEKFLEHGTGFAGEYLFPDEFPNVSPFYSIQLPLETIIRIIAEKPPEMGSVVEVDALLLKRE